MKRYGWTKITIADIIQTSKLTDMINVDEQYLNMSVGQRKVLIAIKCDLCDHVSFDDGNEYVHQEFINVEGEFGWPTIYDGESYDVDICSHCIANAQGIK